MKKKKIKIKNVVIVIVIIFSFALIYSLFNIIMWFKDNKDNKIAKEKTEVLISVIPNIIDDEEQTEEFQYIIDFDSLKEVNNDAIAYLKVPSTSIDYVVVRGKDNDYYLTHNFYKKSNKSGWLFADYKNNFDENDKNIVIYGHNTLDGSMFGTLKKVITKEWYTNKDNYEITLVTKDEKSIYEVFSTYSIDVEDYYIQTDFKDKDEYAKFIKTLKKRSFYGDLFLEFYT